MSKRLTIVISSCNTRLISYTCVTRVVPNAGDTELRKHRWLSGLIGRHSWVSHWILRYFQWIISLHQLYIRVWRTWNRLLRYRYCHQGEGKPTTLLAYTGKELFTVTLFVQSGIVMPRTIISSITSCVSLLNRILSIKRSVLSKY